MWNFSGRQNDIQGYGDIMHGNWITGIKFLDELRLGNQDELPDNLKNEKANNKYYMLPFLLGLLGMFYQYRSDHLCITDYRGFSLGYPLYAEKRDACLEYHPDLFYGDSDRLFFLFDDRYPFIKRSSYRRRKP